MSFPNLYHLRRVAETSSKACYICYKPSTSVLVTPDNKDFFYICPGHLKDRGFCSPIIDEAEQAAKRKKEELEREIERVKKEYEDKQKKKKEKEKKEKGKANKEDEKTDGKEESDGTDSKTDSGVKSSPIVEEPPRVFALHKNIYQMRLDRLRSAEMARRNRERLKSPTTFPSVPTGDL